MSDVEQALRAELAKVRADRDQVHHECHLQRGTIEDLRAVNAALVEALEQEIDRLRAELAEANAAIRELQQEACDRAGVPMPSQRPLVDRLRAELEDRTIEVHALRALKAALVKALETTRMQLAAAMAGKNALSNEKHYSIVEAALAKAKP